MPFKIKLADLLMPKWDSSVIGDIAVPEAISQYSSLYKILVKKLFNDNDFQAALAQQ